MRHKALSNGKKISVNCVVTVRCVQLATVDWQLATDALPSHWVQSGENNLSVRNVLQQERQQRQQRLAYKKEKSASIVNFHGERKRASFPYAQMMNTPLTLQTNESTQTCSNERARTYDMSSMASESARACVCVCVWENAASLCASVLALSSPYHLWGREHSLRGARSTAAHRVCFSFAHSFCCFDSLFWLLLLAGRCLPLPLRVGGALQAKRCCRRCRRRRCRCSLLVARLAIQLSLVESQSKHNQLRFGGTFVRWQRFG